MKHQRKSSILVKIVGVSSILVFWSVLVLALMSIRNIKSVSLETAKAIVQNKIRGDINSLHYMIRSQYGELHWENGHLVDSQNQPLDERYDLIDQISSDLYIAVTIFMRDGNDYRRITTSIIDTSGKRATGTFLGSNSPAFIPITNGRSYIGNALILGKQYITGYEPVFAPNSREVIGILFVGVEMSSVADIINTRSDRYIFIIILISSVILLAAVLLNILIFNRVIVHPVKTIVSILKDISEGEGDLTRQINLNSGDEIGDMAHYFDLTMEKIKKLVIIIKKQAAILFDTGNGLAANMGETAVAINEITTSIQNIKGQVSNQSSSVAETNTIMEQISVNINTLNNHIGIQTTGVSRSSSAIEEMIANIKSVTQTLAKNTDNVKNLANASEVGRMSLQEVAADIQEIARESEGLLEINSVMENIASQTNLLSMNAAIEAAHAGEAGKGFAVVADEIRKLAESSGNQSKTISAVLKKIKDSINKIIQSADEVLNKFEAIDLGVKTVSDQDEHILNVMEEQNTESQQILEALNQLNSTTEMVRDGSGKMLEGSRKIIGESKNLELVTTEITNGMNEMATGSNQINTAVNQVNEISRKNKENIDALVKEVALFKVE
jgi:methyl-accepting chemotaxis protein